MPEEEGQPEALSVQTSCLGSQMAFRCLSSYDGMVCVVMENCVEIHVFVLSEWLA